MPNFTDRIAQGFGDRGGVGSYVNESLPNPQSTLYSYWGGGSGTNGNASIIAQGYSGSVSNTKASDGIYTRIVTVNSIYKNNAPVQQNAVSILFCIRY